MLFAQRIPLHNRRTHGEIVARVYGKGRGGGLFESCRDLTTTTRFSSSYGIPSSYGEIVSIEFGFGLGISSTTTTRVHKS